ncbi:MAG: helix-turn-helix transcriptional regulator [Ruminococcaceae bacterium]|nr:helix-turn-helix transcriptional regulator [Oscillospiraceae bacterium]MBQ2915970.1 helix-turn-helix transcriptional regulator [Clostridia bacterium]
MSMDFGEMLLKERTKRGLSLRAASAIIGISHTYLSELESGHDPRSGQKPLPSSDVMYKICKAYEIDETETSALMGYQDEDSMFLYMAERFRKLKKEDPAKYRRFLNIINEDQ